MSEEERGLVKAFEELREEIRHSLHRLANQMNPIKLRLDSIFLMMKRREEKEQQEK